MGGCPLGAAASRLATRSSIIARLETVERRGEDASRGALLDGIDIANEAILRSGTGGATTLVVVELSAQGMRPYHVGDSTILW